MPGETAVNTPAPPAVTTTPPAAPPVPAAKAERLSPAWTQHLSAKRQLHAEQERLKAEKEAVSKMRAEAEAKLKEAQAFEARKPEFKRNPNAALEAVGLTWDEVAKAQLTDGRPTPEGLAQSAAMEAAETRRKLEEYVKQQEKQREEEDRNEAERQSQTLTQQVRSFADDVAAGIDREPGYPLLRQAKANGEDIGMRVADYIQDHHSTTGKLLRTDEACQIMEQEMEAGIKHGLSNPAIRTLVKKALAELEPPAPPPAETVAPPAPTLTSSVSSRPQLPYPRVPGSMDSPAPVRMGKFSEWRRMKHPELAQTGG